MTILANTINLDTPVRGIPSEYLFNLRLPPNIHNWTLDTPARGVPEIYMLSYSPQLGIAESGTGTDATPSLAVATDISDSMNGTDTNSILNSFSLTDAMSSLDALVFLRMVDLAESGSGAEALELLATYKFITDIGGASLISEDMSVAPVYGVLKGVATWQSAGYVRLTNFQTNNQGQIEYTIPTPVNFYSRADIFRNGSADEVFFYFGCTSTPNNYQSNAGGYVISYNYFLGKVFVSWQGTQIGSVSLTFLNNAFYPAKIIVRGSTIYVYFNNSLLLTLIDSTRTITGTKCGWGARSGGQTADQRVKNLSLSQDVESILAQIPIDETLTAIDFATLPQTFIIVNDTNGPTTEVMDILGSIDIPESLTGTEDLDIFNSFFMTDSGSGDDSNVQTAFVVTVSDSGQEVDQVDIFFKAYDISESGTGTEILSISTSISLSELSSLSDVLSVYKAKVYPKRPKTILYIP